MAGWRTGTGWNYATVPSCVAPSSSHLDVLAGRGGIRIGRWPGAFLTTTGGDQPLPTAALTDLNSKSDQSHNGHISGKVLGICPRIVVAKYSHRRLLTLLIHLQARERDIRDPSPARSPGAARADRLNHTQHRRITFSHNQGFLTR